MTDLQSERPVKRRRRAWWMVTAREARHHAILLATITWLVSIVTTFGGSGRASLVGVFNGPDFLEFYTFGHLAREGRIVEAYDLPVFHAAQVALVPESAEYLYGIWYPPQAAVLFIPFSRLSFENALGLWTVLTVALYAGMIWRAWWMARDRLTDRILVFAAAAAFPPFWQTVMNGQVTIVILGSCFLAWLALERQRHFAAGLALGLLALKPQFGLPFAVIVIVRRDWRMLLGAIVSVAAQSLLVWSVLGPAAFSSYLDTLPTIAAHADALEPKPFQSHSIRALTRLLPEWVGIPIWIGLTGTVLWKTAQAWCTDTPIRIRLGLAMLASVLVNPHLIVYDAAILVLPLLWFAEMFADHGDSTDGRRFGALLYGLFLAFLFPTAQLLRVQASVILMLWMFVIVQRRIREPAPEAVLSSL